MKIWKILLYVMTALEILFLIYMKDNIFGLIRSWFDFDPKEDDYILGAVAFFSLPLFWIPYTVVIVLLVKKAKDAFKFIKITAISIPALIILLLVLHIIMLRIIHSAW